MIKSSCPSASTCPSRHTRQTASSDPPSQSDDTPPSSPPPQAIPASMKDGLAQVTSSPREGRRISMSWYQRRRRGALTELTTANAQKPARVKRRPRLTQTHIDLGQGVRTLCKTCGMDYISSNDEDALWHKRFHAMNVGGVDLGRNVSRSLRAKKLWSPDEAAEASEGRTEGFIAVVDKNASLGERQKAKQVLQVVNTELSAVELDHGEDKRTAAAASLGTGDGSDGAKTFLYVKGDKCVGLCLARRISQAHRVSGWKKESGASAVSRSSSVSISHETEPAVLGISRIWTSNSHRRQGIGRRLLECAKDHFVYGMSVPKARIAFSQPTESGGYLAEGWFGGATGWQVYLEG
ncbi:MAG: hypothetical protein M1838_001659 [Thelocarpon superellum]|nr:MAG: hypothetical protein M1838_001659 [Thelocarpon superellum]